MTRRMSAKSAEVFSRLLPEADRAAYLAAQAAPSNARAAGGRTAKERGDAWEAWITGQHKVAWMMRLARVRKVGPPIAFTGSGGTDIIVTGRGPADYQGAIRGERRVPWRPLALEAKSYEGRLQRHHITPWQHEDLAAVGGDLVGGVALVVIELHDEAGVTLGTWALPYAELERRWSKTSRAKPGRAGSTDPRDLVVSASVGPDELAGWEITSDCYLTRFAGRGA